MPKIKGDSKVPLQFRVDPKDAEDLAFFAKYFRGKCEADLLREALSLYLGELRREYAKRTDLQLYEWMAGGPKVLYLGSPTPPAQKQIGPSRNGPCPCGSGLKYKRCCAGKGSDELVIEQVNRDFGGVAQPVRGRPKKAEAIDIDAPCR